MRFHWLAAAFIAAVPAFTAAPAAAAVSYDPVEKTGFVGAADLRKAFGWDERTLAAHASAVAFEHEFWTDDTYAVTCGGRPFDVVHHSDFGRFELGDAIVRTYGKILGFKVVGPHTGISGTSVGPEIGGPCPRENSRPGVTIDSVRPVSSAVGWTLSVTVGEQHRNLRTRTVTHKS